MLDSSLDNRAHHEHLSNSVQRFAHHGLRQAYKTFCMQYKTFCMLDEARSVTVIVLDTKMLILNLTSFHGVLDCPKKNQAITYSACLITSMKVSDRSL